MNKTTKRLKVCPVSLCPALRLGKCSRQSGKTQSPVAFLLFANSFLAAASRVTFLGKFNEVPKKEMHLLCKINDVYFCNELK